MRTFRFLFFNFILLLVVAFLFDFDFLKAIGLTFCISMLVLLADMTFEFNLFLKQEYVEFDRW